MSTSTNKPEGVWWDHGINTLEKLWLAIVAIWAFILFGWMAGWAMVGNQNPIGKTYRVKTSEFKKQIMKYVKNTPKTPNGFLKPSSEDIYIAGRRYAWVGTPLVLKAGKEYQLHLGSFDVQHGFGLHQEQVLSKQATLQVLPGYEWILPFQINTPGTYHIVCNQFCGLGHRTMHGKIVVRE